VLKAVIEDHVSGHECRIQIAKQPERQTAKMLKIHVFKVDCNCCRVLIAELELFDAVPYPVLPTSANRREKSGSFYCK
jgi:hypothetical protein